jgi:hypothetical protein
MTDLQPILQELAALHAKVDALQAGALQPRQGYFTRRGAAVYLGWFKKDGSPNWEKVRTLNRRRLLPYSQPCHEVLIAKRDLDALMARTRMRHPLKPGKKGVAA